MSLKLLSCIMFVKSKLSIDSELGYHRDLKKVGWHFFQIQYGCQNKDGRHVKMQNCTLRSKKEATKLLALTLSNLNRF